MKQKSNAYRISLKVATAIKEARETKQLSRDAFMERLERYGVSLGKESIKSYENPGRVTIPSDNLFIIAYILDIDLSKLWEEIRKEIQEI